MRDTLPTQLPGALPEDGGSGECQLKAQAQLAKAALGSSRIISDGSPWEMQQKQWQIALLPVAT